jgi:hypothetical protein
MSFSNFSFLEARWPKLSELGKHAEQYAYSDPQSAVIKLRCFSELLVGYIYSELQLPILETDNFFEKLNNETFRDVVERPILDKLHAIRVNGNKAAHQGGSSTDAVHWLIKEAFFIGCWFYMTHSSGNENDLPAFCKPTSIEPVQHLARDNETLNQKLNLQAANLQKALEELNVAQQAGQQAQRQIDQLHQQVDEAKLLAFKISSNRAASKIDFEEGETQRRISIQDAFAEFTLTDGQSELVNQLDGFLNNKHDKVFLLKGYAGTGKTFIAKGLTEYLRAIGRNYILAAPTGKASKVIAKKTKSPAYTIHKTIYSFKDIVEYKDDNLEGSETYKLYAKLAVNENSADTVYIIDESSMIADIYQESEFFRCGSGFLLKDLIKFINLDHNDHNKKIIFIGDDAQLTPVGMQSSPALDAGYLLKEHNLKSTGYVLTDVVRQKAESGVIHNSLKLRKALNENDFNQLDIDLNFLDIEDIDYRDLLPVYLRSCNNKINAESIIIAYSNTDVAEYNKRIRKHFFPNNPEITRNDKVMAVTNSSAHGFFISNGDFGLIRYVYGEPEERKVKIRRKSTETGIVEEIQVRLKFRNVNVGFKDLDGNPHFFDANIIESLLYSDEPSLSSDENKALYLDFCIRNSDLTPGSLEFKETLRSDPYFNALRLKFGYAITCHKAQGSEWNHVFVKCKAHPNQRCSEYFRWLYTAITRTAEHVYLLDKPHITPWDSIKVVSSPAEPWTFPNDVTLPTLISSETSSGKKSMPLTQEVEVEVEVDRNNEESGNNTFGIPDHCSFLLSILSAVNNAINNSGIYIAEIQHHQWQEAYFFQKGDGVVRINLSYNSKNKITSISAMETCELSSQIVFMLTPLQGRVMVSQAAGEQSKTVQFTESFLQQFHEHLSNLCESHGITISNVEALQNAQRYSFSKSGDVATVDIYYTGKNRFSKCIALRNACSSPVLLDELMTIINSGMA